MADPVATTSNITAAEIAALGALVGAFIGSVTGFITKQISDSLEKQDKRRELIRSKLEEFTHALATAYTWSRALEKCRYLEEAKALGECSESHRIIAFGRAVLRGNVPRCRSVCRWAGQLLPPCGSGIKRASITTNRSSFRKRNASRSRMG